MRFIKHFVPALHLMGLFIIGSSLALPAKAAPLTLHQLFSSHMVLQHDASDPVWGWATPAATVTVKVYNQNAVLLQTQTAVAGADGHWQAIVSPLSLVPGNAAYSLTISDGTTTITLTDVLIGDVWLCSGQSNMQFSLDTIGVTNLTAEIADSANYPDVRNFNVPLVSSLVAQTNLSSGSWQVAGPSTTPNFSATAYFTAREIYKQQHIPIGILCSAYAGTQIQVWLDPAFVAGIADFTLTNYDQIGQTPGSSTFSGLYNAMILPLVPFSIKAVEWYQGEYNTSWPEQYSRLLPGLMSKWRLLFNQPNLPFIIIQLPNFGGAQTQPVETGSWAELREAQLKTVLNDAHARIVTTIDIGDGLLHPIDKQDVGQRAAWAAASLVYGQNVINECPLLAGTSVSGRNVICTFTNVGNGLMIGTKSLSPLSPASPVTGTPLANFALSGANKIFYAATAVISATNQVTISSSSVSTPVAVRYAWGGNPPGNLYSTMKDGNGNITNGLPAGSLRTDPVNLLTVNLGTGTGYYPSNAQTSITASNLAGETFAYWSGDTNLLSNISSTTVTATQAQEYVSVLANYVITGAPSGVVAVSIPGQIALDWNPLAAVHYNVKRSTTSGGPYTVLASNLVGQTAYLDGSVKSGTTYYYVVSAVNLLGEGPNSAQTSAMPAPGTPFTTNTWDANGLILPNPVDGSGTWLTTSNWWTGSTNVNGHWTTAPTDSAIFGAGTAGTYKIDLGGNSITASNITFNTSGYTLTNGTLTLLGSITPIIVNSGITGTVKNALTVSSGNISLQVNSGGTLSLADGASFNGNLVLEGGGTVDLNAGTFAGGNFALWAQTSLTQEAATLNTVRIMVGYGGNCTYTMNNPGAVTTSTGGGGDSFIGRAGTTGTWDLKQGTVTLTALSGDNLRVGYDATSKGTLTVEGGLLNLGNNILYVNSGGTSSTGAGTVNLSGGMVTASGIQIGGGGTYSAGATAAFNLTGGTLYPGAGGISLNALGTLATTVWLSGGIVGATASWATSLPMTLTNTHGYVTFQAADGSGNPANITLAGALNGSGGLVKTGGGTLVLSGGNAYSGGTTINAGTLSLTTTNNVLMAYTNNSGTLNVKVAASGSSQPASGLTFGNGGPQVIFDLAGLGNTTAPLINSGTIAMNGNVTVNVTNAPTGGTSVLLVWSGTRNGTGTFVAGQIPPNASIVDDAVARRVSLTYLPAKPPQISGMGVAGSNLAFSGTGGTAFSTYRLLSSSNMTAPFASWTPVWTNAFDAAGGFNFNLPAQPVSLLFYRLVTP